MPEISVIMPCYNGAKLLSRGVDSVLFQNFTDLELIVVDDGSTDESPSVLQSIGDSRLRVLRQSNMGVSAARNVGLIEARGTFVAFLDTDDTWRPDCLEKLHAALLGQPEAVLTYCGWQNVGLGVVRAEPYVPPDYEGESKWEHFLRACPWPIHASLAKLSHVRSVGGFDEGLRTSEDYKMWLEICIAGRVVRVPEVMAFYHFHDGPQATKAKAEAAKRSFQVKRAFLSKHPEIVSKIGRKQIRRLLYGTLLKKGYECYWGRDLVNARIIFRYLLKFGYGKPADWIYMLSALLPMRVHSAILDAKDGR